MCNELFFVALYLLKWYPDPLGLNAAAYLPDALYTQMPAKLDHFLEKSLTWPFLLAAVTFPVCLGKQIINCVQFWKAAKSLTDLDREERWIAQQEKKRM